VESHADFHLILAKGGPINFDDQTLIDLPESEIWSNRDGLAFADAHAFDGLNEPRRDGHTNTVEIFQRAFTLTRLKDGSIGILHGEFDANNGFRFYAHGDWER